MATVADMLENLKALDIKKEALVSIAATSGKILDLNREQLLHGKRSDGTTMPPYSEASVKKFHKPAGPILLYDTGRFQQSFKLDVGSSKIEFLSEDLHDLKKRYGDNIFGLGATNQEYYNQEVFLPEFSQKIESQTGLKIK